MSLKLEAKQTLKLAFPIIFGEIAQIALHLIDTAMIGATGGDSYKQIAAAALAFNFVTIPFVLGIGMTMSISQLVSMAKGRNDDKLVSHYFYNGFIISTITALIICIIIELGGGFMYNIGIDREIIDMALPFLRVIGISIFPMLLFMALKQFADGLEETRTAMFLSIIALPINVILNYLLVFGNFGFPRLEMMGAAYATLITRSLIFVALAIVILKSSKFKIYIKHKNEQWHLKKSTIKELLKIGIPSSLQVGMEAGVFAVSGIIVGTLGDKELAAHQIAIQSASLTFMVSMGLAHAGSIRVSNAFGRNEWNKIENIAKSTLFMALGYGIFCAILFIACRNLIPDLFLQADSVGNNEVIAIATTLLLFAAIFQISDATQAISAGLLRGIKDVNIPTQIIGIAYWILGLPIGCLLAYHFEINAIGIWIGFIIGLTFSSIMLTKRFFKMIKIKKLQS